MSQFSGKNIAILGLSVEGKDSVKFFVSEKANVLCADGRTQKQLGEVYREIAEYPVNFQLGKGYLRGLESYDMIVRTPGMAPWLPELQELLQRGKEVTSLTRLFFDLCPAPIVGVTGTKGKGTTSTLIYNMLKGSGKHVFLGGNVGTPLLSRVRSIRKNDWVVLELSSFQLEDLTQSPHVAVVLRTTQEHLANYDPLATNYHRSKEAYVEAKRSIVRYQSRHDVAILHRDDPTSSSFANDTPATVYYFSRFDTTCHAYVDGTTVRLRWDGRVEDICTLGSIKLRGMHNLENIAAAALASRAAGASVEAIRKSARNFEGLEHRLEFVRRTGGVSYFNDSFSTVPETAIAALQSFNEPIILIAGGSEKGSDFTQLGGEIARGRVKTLIAIGAMTQRIAHAAKVAGYQRNIITGLRSMREIVATAAGEAAQGDVVLLSPACASFDMFKNYKYRGKEFKDEVARL